MADDVYLREHGCYLNEANRDGFALKLLRKSLSIASRCTWPDVQVVVPAQVYEYWNEGEWLVDLFRVTVGVENYLKARLLLDDYVVHLIDAHHLSGLHREQRARHIRIEELATFQQVKDRGTDQWRISGLTLKTISWHSLLAFPPHYLDAEILAMVTKIGNQRNTLHYLEAEPGDMDCAELGRVTEFLAADVPARVNELAIKMKWPAMMYERDA